MRMASSPRCRPPSRTPSRCDSSSKTASWPSSRCPRATSRRLILIYESAEGGAGVLRRLVEDPQASRRVAREALRICHFDPDTGADLRRGKGAREDCEAACYDCLMSYCNQPDHGLLDRQLIQPILSQLSRSHVAAAPVPRPASEHLEMLLRLAGSELERAWLRFLDAREHRLPTGAQELIAQAGTRPDFVYCRPLRRHLHRRAHAPVSPTGTAETSS